jgi:hypothetical protein
VLCDCHYAACQYLPALAKVGQWAPHKAVELLALQYQTAFVQHIWILFLSPCLLPMLLCAGFCAPPTLTLTQQRSGGRLANSRGSGVSRRTGSGKAPYTANATLHVVLTAAYWLDNRSGLNLVLSDLDRRWLRGLPGPGLKSECVVHI